MALIIDGYNLLHASGILPRGLGPHGLQRARDALLDFLAASLDPAEISHTTVVFDAPAKGRGLPRSTEHKGITVRFALDQESADELIEQLIQSDSAPRRLTVVSSDHRLHRAARRRRATAVDSDRWHAAVVRRRLARQSPGEPFPGKPDAPLTPHEVEFWLRTFGQRDDGGKPASS